MRIRIQSAQVVSGAYYRLGVCGGGGSAGEGESEDKSKSKRQGELFSSLLISIGLNSFISRANK